jgi:hypothetical protein
MRARSECLSWMAGTEKPGHDVAGFLRLKRLVEGKSSNEAWRRPFVSADEML